MQGEKPSHPALLDDLAARFIAHGWSLKWLHREILLSAAYQQASQPRADAAAADPLNSLFWRMNPRRLDIESYRDSLLRAAGKLSEEMYGPSQEVDAPGNYRRTVYARVSRARLNNLFKQYDYPDPIQTASGRDLTTTSLQQLVPHEQLVHRRSCPMDSPTSVANETGCCCENPQPVPQGAVAGSERGGNADCGKLSIASTGAPRLFAICADSVVDQREDFLAMTIQFSRRRNDPVSLRRAWLPSV